MTATLLNSFVSAYWDGLACDPDRWCYTPNTYGVEGVTLVGDIHMKAWDELNPWHNPGRALGADLGKVEKLKEDIETYGINTDSPVVYYDIDNNDRINGEHRFLASEQLGIVGWMAQAVRFDSEAAKIEFATVSNKKRGDVHTPPSSADIESAIRALINLGAISTDEEIKEKVRFLATGAISESSIKTLYNKLIVERMFSGKVSPETRFCEWNDDRLQTFFDNSEDTWLDEYYNNSSEYTMYINMRNFEARVGSLLNMASQAAAVGKPLHLLLSVPIQQREQLDTTRGKVFTDRLQTIERYICNIMGVMHERYASNFAWNHPDCEHRFLPQDLMNEENDKLLMLNWE